jgi:uncharacterized lipoprotein YajG
MKKLIVYLVAVFGLVSIVLVTGCQKQTETTPEMPSTNAPAMPSTNGM